MQAILLLILVDGCVLPYHDSGNAEQDEAEGTPLWDFGHGIISGAQQPAGVGPEPRPWVVPRNV